MSLSKKSAGPKGPRKSHALRRHRAKAAPTSNLPPHARHIAALDALGWRVVAFRPSIPSGESSLWDVTITRVDLDASMTVTATNPDVALAELVRYASADATEKR